MLPNKKNINKRQLMAAKTRNKLLTVSFAMFAKHGFERVTVDQIIEHAGFSKGAFYNHFQSKDDVVLQQFQEIDSKYLEFIAQLNNNHPPFTQLLCFLKLCTEYVTSTWGVDMMRVIYSNQLKVPANGTTKMLLNEKRGIYVFFRQLLRQGQQRGEFRQDLTAAFMARILIRCFRSFIYDWCMANGDFDLTEELQKHCRLLFDVIKHR